MIQSCFSSADPSDLSSRNKIIWTHIPTNAGSRHSALAKNNDHKLFCNQSEASEFEIMRQREFT
jgi:hypothetical protein